MKVWRPRKPKLRTVVLGAVGVNVLGVLAMSAPAEIELARLAGFSDWTAYAAPAALSLYSILAAASAGLTEKKTVARYTAIAASVVAVLVAMSSQVVGHLVTAGYVVPNWLLLSIVSAVPSLSAAHLIHVAFTFVKGAKADVTEESPLPDWVREELERREKSPEDLPDVKPVEEMTLEEIADELTSLGQEMAEEETPKKPGKRGAAPKVPEEKIRSFVDSLKDMGEEVTSTKLAEEFGVSPATAGRYLKKVSA
ncbi:hypothetical protein [Streptomyces sp. NPDC002644]